MAGNANANSIPFLHRRGIDVSKIMDSMILWYDIKKQLEQYNKPEYIVDFTKGGPYGNNITEETEGTIHITYLVATANSRIWAWEQQITYPFDFAENVIEVSGLPENIALRLYPSEEATGVGSAIPIIDIPTDGRYTIPAVSSEGEIPGYLITYAEEQTEDYGECDITITQVASTKTPNEYFAETNKLIDLSSNGHDATCYNFAWAGMSGIGGFKEPFVGGNFTEINTNNIIEGTIKENIIHITKVNDYANVFINTGTDVKTVQPFTIKVTGIKETGAAIIYEGLKDVMNVFSIIFEDGIYELPIAENVTKCGFRINDTIESCNIIIEEIPQYPNAIISDGIDDYAQVTGLPINDNYYLLSKEEVSHELSSGTLTLFKKVNNTEYSSVPLYSLLLFDRTLTDKEIDYVKKHLIGVDDNSENIDANLPSTGN